MNRPSGSRQLRDQIVGKRISAVIARPGRAGEPPMVMMMQFDDGSVVEFVSPRGDRLLRRAMSAEAAPPACQPELPMAGLAA